MSVKQRFGKKEITQTKVVNNLLRYYKLATPEELEAGKKWYTQANEFCQQLSEQYGLELYKVVGIVSALSPQTSWSVNRQMATEFIKNRGRGFMGNRERTIKAKKIYNCNNAIEAEDYLSTKPGKALKTRAFFRNILLPGFCDTCTIDRHALAAAIQRPDKTYSLSDKEAHISPAKYRFLSGCYIHAARRVGMIPSNYQALIWEKYRSCRGLNKPVPNNIDFIPVDMEDF